MVKINWLSPDYMVNKYKSQKNNIQYWDTIFKNKNLSQKKSIGSVKNVQLIIALTVIMYDLIRLQHH